MADFSDLQVGDEEVEEENEWFDVEAVEPEEDFIEDLERMHEGFTGLDTLERNDQEELLRKLNVGNKARARTMLYGRFYNPKSEGDEELVRDRLQKILDQRLDCESLEDFLSMFLGALESDEYSLYSLRNTEDKIHEKTAKKVGIIADFLDSEGEEREILGETHYVYVFNDPEEVKKWEAYQEPRETAVSEIKFIQENCDLNISRLYNKGWIGKITENNGIETNVRTNTITMSEELVNEYSQN